MGMQECDVCGEARETNERWMISRWQDTEDADLLGDIYYHHTIDSAPETNRFVRHCHEFCELIYVARGEGSYVAEGERCPLRDGTMLLIGPRLYHYVDVEKSCPYERYVIQFPEKYLMRAGTGEERDGYVEYCREADLPMTVRDIFAKLDCLSSMPKKEAKLLIQLLLQELLLILSLQRTRERYAPANEPLAAKAIRYINEHLTEPLSLESLSKEFYVSKFYLCRAFREYNGISVVGYINGKRVMYARQLMNAGETAASAAAKAGFGDYSSFYRAYRRVMGRAPTEYAMEPREEKEAKPQSAGTKNNARKESR